MVPPGQANADQQVTAAAFADKARDAADSSIPW